MLSLHLSTRPAAVRQGQAMQRSHCASNGRLFVGQRFVSMRPTHHAGVETVSVAAPVEIAPEEQPMFEVRETWKTTLSFDGRVCRIG